MRREAASVLSLLLVGGCFSPNQAGEGTESASSTSEGNVPADSTEGGTVGPPTGTPGTGSTSGTPTSGMDGSTSRDNSTSEATSSSGAETGRPAIEGTTTSGEDDTTGPGCADDCVVLPGGWNGPIVLSEGAVPPACQDGGEPEFVGYSGLDASPATCGCECGESDVICPEAGSISNRGTPNQLACFLFVTPTWTSNVGPGCNDIPDVLSTTSELVLGVDDPLNLGGSSCSPLATTDVPPATWSSGWSGCAADAAVGSCDVCLSEAEGLCIWSEGDVDCNVSGFGEKTLLFGDVDDGRECTACECGEPEGSCGGTVTYRASDSCGLANVGSGGARVCVDVEFARGAAVEFENEYACSPSGGSPAGTASGGDPTTVCCAG